MVSMSDINFKKIKIGIIDLKSHNLFSIFQATKNIGYNVTTISNYKQIIKKDIIILPGVGSFKHAMKHLKDLGVDYELKNFVLKKNKCLFGICLGMQLLFSSSEEFGFSKGLNLIEGRVRKLKARSRNIKIPHVGWNNIKKKNHNFIPKNLLKHKYYFTHSFYCEPINKEEIHTETYYGGNFFCSSIFSNKVVGTQFHPEKSGMAGLKILKNLKKII